MNIIDLQERLKDLPEQSLMQEMQMPTGTAPQFLVLSELKRRKRMRDEYQRQQAQGMQTVAEEAVTAAGMPQEGIMGISRAMAPRSAIAQDTGVNDMMQAEATRAPQPQEMPVQGMYDGGYVRKMQPGGFVDRQQQGYLIFLQQMNLADSPEAQEMYVRMMERQTENPSPPSLFNPEMDTAPQGLSGVSADVSAFLPGADTLPILPGADTPPMMSAPPALSALSPQINASPVDFDASVPELPQELLDESQSGMTAAELLAASAAEQGLSPASVAALSAKPLDLAGVNMARPGYISGNAPINMGVVPEAEGTNALQAQREELAYNVQGGRAGPQTALPTMASMLRLGPGPNRSGLNLTDEPYDMGPNSLAKIPEALSGTVNIDAEGNISVEYPEEPPAIDEAAPEKAAAQDKAADTKLAGLAAAKAAADGLSYGLGSLDTGTIDVGPDGIPLSFGTAATGAATQPSTTTSDISGGDGGGGGALSSIESRVARMIEEREKSAQADKWLALAQTGLALMASDQPTIGGAIGEAGLAGIGAMQQARSAYDKDILTLLDAQAGLQRARSSGGGRSRRQSPAELKGSLEYFNGIKEDLATVTSVDDFGQEVTTKDYTRVPRDLQATIKQLEDQYLAAVQGGMVDYNATQ